MPEGCNFYGLLQTELDTVAVAGRFKAAGWSVTRADGHERLEIVWGRLSLTGGNPMVLRGWLDRPDDRVGELLDLLRGSDLTGVYQWINAQGHLWREMPFDESLLDPDDPRLPADIKASVLASRAKPPPEASRPWWRFW
jgi:hypothetical protein